VFVDANILAKALTRSLVMLAAEASGYTVTWSAYAETEADRHATRTSKLVSVVRRTKTNQELSPTGEGAERFTSTKASDRQILADAIAAKARFIVTEDVDDFGHVDLVATAAYAA
jgi:predicted nucleic acid-binding protein